MPSISLSVSQQYRSKTSFGPVRALLQAIHLRILSSSDRWFGYDTGQYRESSDTDMKWISVAGLFLLTAQLGALVDGKL